MLGAEKGNASHIMFTAFVIQFSNDSLSLDYPAFYGHSNITLSNVDIDFDNKTQILKITNKDAINFDGLIEDSLLHLKYQSPSAYEEFKNCFNEDGVCILRFNGQKFIK